MSLTFEEVLKSAFAKTIKDVLDEREQRIKTDGDKQDALESGVNIKTVTGQSILGAGNLEAAGAANVYMIQEGDITFVSQESRILLYSYLQACCLLLQSLRRVLIFQI